LVTSSWYTIVVDQAQMERQILVRFKIKLKDWQRIVREAKKTSDVNGLTVARAFSRQGLRVVGTAVPLTLVRGDMIVKVNGEEVRTVKALRSAMKKVVQSTFEVYRGPYPLTVLLQPTKPPPDFDRHQDLRKTAPTCGPCCHGHCNDKLEGLFDIEE
jgi:hypothetical protein